jgi:hypothetical protein
MADTPCCHMSTGTGAQLRPHRGSPCSTGFAWHVGREGAVDTWLLLGVLGGTPPPGCSDGAFHPLSRYNSAAHHPKGGVPLVQPSSFTARSSSQQQL